MRRQQSLAEILPLPVTVAQFWRNRRGEAVRIALQRFAGVTLIDVRVFYSAPDGKLQPTPKGLSVNILRLPELHAAITKALKQARDMGLLDG